MPKLVDNLKTAGTIIAIVLSIAAFFHTIWAEQKSRMCDFLYSKHDRAYNLARKMDHLSSSYDQMRGKIGGLSLTDPQFTNLSEDESTRLLRSLVSERLNMISPLQREFELSQVMIDNEDMKAIKEKGDNLIEKAEAFAKKIKGNDVMQKEDLLELFYLADEAANLMKKVSDSSLKETANELRNACGDQ